MKLWKNLLVNLIPLISHQLEEIQAEREQTPVALRRDCCSYCSHFYCVFPWFTLQWGSSVIGLAGKNKSVLGYLYLIIYNTNVFYNAPYSERTLLLYSNRRFDRESSGLDIRSKLSHNIGSSTYIKMYNFSPLLFERKILVFLLGNY